jgi:predicted  nucleic acid-binding Zn-ribbon protein
MDTEEAAKEPQKAVKTKEQLAEDRVGYLGRVLQLEDELHNLKEREPNLRDELMQLRGALAYTEMALHDLEEQQQEIDKEFAAAAKKALQDEEAAATEAAPEDEEPAAPEDDE